MIDLAIPSVGFDPTDLQQITLKFDELSARTLASVSDLEQWLADFSTLYSTIDECGTRRYIARTCDTNNPDIEKAYLHFVEVIEPALKKRMFELQKKFLNTPARSELKGQRYDMLTRKWETEVSLFRQENIDVQTQITLLGNEFDKINGAMSVEMNGKDITLQQAGKMLEDPNRQLRQEVWEKIAKRRLSEREKLEDLFDRILPLRQKLAENAGLKDFRQYVWKDYKRFDYTPEMCIDFAKAVEEVVMPLVKKLDERRAKILGVEKLRPWDRTTGTSDTAPDITGPQPLRPFDAADVEGLVGKTVDVFGKLSGELANQFAGMRQRGNLDLVSRKGKAPGGYQSSLELSRQPFIFMNAAGLQKDIETLLHEGGHAFHYLAAASEPLVFLRSAPIEFCEVASMGMELLAGEHLEIYYANQPKDAERARTAHFESTIRFFPWMAMIDQFQHWLYTHPGHSRSQRTDYWRELMQRFGGSCDWSGYEDARDAFWQRQLHLFHVPFYYVEYGIAQLGALQLWLAANQDPARALANYRGALALGGTRPLPRLFEAAGLHFDFSKRTIAPLMQAVADRLGL